jgi:hypothetical protein
MRTRPGTVSSPKIAQRDLPPSFPASGQERARPLAFSLAEAFIALQSAPGAAACAPN